MHEIIVGVDESATAKIAATQAAELALQTGKPLHLVMALKRRQASTFQAGAERVVIDNISLGEDFLRSLKGELPGGMNATHAVMMKDPADALCYEAERLGASMIVVGNRRVQGVTRVLGSIPLDVAKQAPCNVYIVHTTG